MNLNSLYYFYEIAVDLNLTKTAARLYISQQALSKSLSLLEREYHAQFFVRKPHLRLTPAGDLMLKFAKDVLNSQRNFNDVLADISEENIGTIRFGASYLRSNFCLSRILPIFSKKYPRVNITVTDNTSAVLHNLLLEDELDVALCSLNEHVNDIATKLLLTDNIYFCVTDRLLKQYYPDNYQELKEKSFQGAYLGDFAKLPFLTLSNPNKLGITMTKCFEEADFTPYSYLSATFTSMFPSLCSDGLAACVCTQMTLNTHADDLAPDLNIFPLLYNKERTYHNMYLAYAKDKYLTKYLLYFMELVEECFASVNTNSLAKK